MSPRKRLKRKSLDTNKKKSGKVPVKSRNVQVKESSDCQELSNALVLKYLEDEGFIEIHQEFLQVISKQSDSENEPELEYSRSCDDTENLARTLVLDYLGEQGFCDIRDELLNLTTLSQIRTDPFNTEDHRAEKKKRKLHRAEEKERQIHRAVKKMKEIHRAEKKERKLQRAEEKQRRLLRAEKNERKLQRAEQKKRRIHRAKKKERKLREAEAEERKFHKAEKKKQEIHRAEKKQSKVKNLEKVIQGLVLDYLDEQGFKEIKQDLEKILSETECPSKLAKNQKHLCDPSKSSKSVTNSSNQIEDEITPLRKVYRYLKSQPQFSMVAKDLKSVCKTVLGVSCEQDTETEYPTRLVEKYSHSSAQNEDENTPLCKVYHYLTSHPELSTVAQHFKSACKIVLNYTWEQETGTENVQKWKHKKQSNVQSDQVLNETKQEIETVQKDRKRKKDGTQNTEELSPSKRSKKSSESDCQDELEVRINTVSQNVKKDSQNIANFSQRTEKVRQNSENPILNVSQNARIVGRSVKNVRKPVDQMSMQHLFNCEQESRNLISRNHDVNQNPLPSRPEKVIEKTLSKSKRLIENDVESIKTKKRKLFDNNVSTKPSFQSVNKDVDVICVDDEDSSDSETGCQENQNITTQPLPSEVPNQSFENHREEQDEVEIENFLKVGHQNYICSRATEFSNEKERPATTETDKPNPTNKKKPKLSKGKNSTYNIVEQRPKICFKHKYKLNAKRAVEIAESFEEKTLSSLSPILDGYGDLLCDLNPDSLESEVDKVVKYILDHNIPVPHVNIVLSGITTGQKSIQLNKLSLKGLIVVGRFTPGVSGENASILRCWNKLITNVPIFNPSKCINDFAELQSSEKKFSRKKNVLGCYLGQDLAKVRHASDIFLHTLYVLNPPVSKGKFTKEEDQMILSEVAKSGESIKTWKHLAVILNREYYRSVQKRFQTLTVHQFLFKGKFDISEDEFILQSLFGGKKDTGVQEIEAVTLKNFSGIAKSLNRIVANVSLRWKGYLKPVLVSHHCGTLHRPWKRELFNYLIDKKVIGRQDINYRELKIIFPEQNSYSILQAISNYKAKPCEQNFVLWKCLSEVLLDLKDDQDSERIKKLREDIVNIYDNVKNK